MSPKKSYFSFVENVIEYLIFAARWFQAPIYLGLVVGTGLYTYKFMEELAALAMQINEMEEIHVMLAILGLIDISMVMNLLVIVIVGGYSIFTSRLDFDGVEDKPQWLDHLDADRLKVKLSTSLASVSGVHLLKTFMDIHSEAKTEGLTGLYYEIGIHLVFILSSLMLAWIVVLLGNRGEAVRDSH